VPGFNAAPGEELLCSMWARGRTFGTALRPQRWAAAVVLRDRLGDGP
jgi:hypothetical protein